MNLDGFHFLEPVWLLMLLPLPFLIGWLKNRSQNNSAWTKVIEPQLLKHLLLTETGQVRSWPLWILLSGWLIVVLALANPVWEKKIQQVFQTPNARVIVFDLSASMTAADLKPSRLLRARLKLEDILKNQQEGQTGLVVFAGDAFSVTPLTRDNDTMLSQLRALEPSIMPAQGSRVDLALERAYLLLKQAGIGRGDVLLMADGFESDLSRTQAKQLAKAGHRLSVLGIGTPDGAPIQDSRGNFLKEPGGKPVIATLDESGLQQLAKAGGGIYRRISSNDSDIRAFLDLPPLNLSPVLSKEQIESNQWKQQGPLLVVLLLPLAALAFRRGWLLSVVFVIGLIPAPKTAMAFGWQDLWQTKEQQAAKAFEQQQHEQTLELSKNPELLGSAHYRQQQYQKALENFLQADKKSSANDFYNSGNALARLGKYKEAIESYDQALNIQPNMEDAAYNKKLLEEMLKQQKQEQQQSQQDNQQQNEEQQNQGSDNQQQDASGQGDKQGEQQQQSGQQAQNQSQPEQEKKQEQKPGEKNDQNQQADESPSPGASADQNQEQAQNPENQFADANEQQEKQQEGQEQQESQNQQSQTSPQSETQNQPQQAQQEPSPNEEIQVDDYDAKELSDEEKLAAEQWLRRIPDDPGGLLKRKFKHQYQQRHNRTPGRQQW